MIDITNVLAYGILFGIALAAVLAAKFWPGIKAEVTYNQLKLLILCVDELIQAFEVIIKGEKRGQERKERVIAVLAKMGFKVDLELLSAIIDAEVAAVINSGNAE